MTIIKGEFARNVATLITGTAIAQAIAISVTPILTRIFTPSDYGVFAIYMAFVSIISAFSSGRYESALMLPEKDKDAVNVLALSVFLSAMASIILFLTIVLFDEKIISYLGNSEISSWLYLIPISIILTCIYQCLNYWSNRNKRYLKISQSKISQTGSTAASSISLGSGGLFANGGGLILGGLIGQIISSMFLLIISLKKDSTIFKQVKIKRMLLLGKKYKKFPMYDLPAYATFTIYSNLAVLFFNKFFESSIAGFYFLSNRLMQIPVTLFSRSFAEVFYQKLSQIKQIELISKELNFYSLKIAKVSILPFLLLVYSSSLYIEFLLGQDWKDLYKYIIIFSIPSFFKLWFSPYGYVLKVVNRQEVSFYSHAIRLLVMVAYLSSYFFIEYEMLWFLFFYAILESTIHTMMVFFVDRVICNRELYKLMAYRLCLIIILGFLNFYLIFVL